MAELENLHVVVTRPQAQAEPWAQKLRDLGAVTSVISLLEIVPVSGDAQIQAVKNCILNLDLFCKAIFVSQNAVNLGFEWIENYWPQLPMGVDFFAVGETTARQLEERGVPVTDLARAQAGAMDSEALLASPALQQVAGEKIVIFRGLGGRPHLGEVLSARGAQVSYCEIYERKLPAGSAAEFAQLLAQYTAQANSLLVITVHSGEALQNLHILSQGFGKLPQADANTYLLVPSQRVADLATAAGWAHVVAAQNATDACMLQGLIELKHTLTKV